MLLKNSNTTLVKVKLTETQLTKLEQNYSNTTLVKVKFDYIYCYIWSRCYSNTTLVKVKFDEAIDESTKKIEFKYNTC